MSVFADDRPIGGFEPGNFYTGNPEFFPVEGMSGGKIPALPPDHGNSPWESCGSSHVGFVPAFPHCTWHVEKLENLYFRGLLLQSFFDNKSRINNSVVSCRHNTCFILDRSEIGFGKCAHCCWWCWHRRYGNDGFDSHLLSIGLDDGLLPSRPNRSPTGGWSSDFGFPWRLTYGTLSEFWFPLKPIELK